MLDGRDEDAYLAHAERVGPYLTLLRGIALEEENIRWAERALAIIEHRLVRAREGMSGGCRGRRLTFADRYFHANTGCSSSSTGSGRPSRHNHRSCSRTAPVGA